MFREQVSDGWDPVAEGNRAGYGIPVSLAREITRPPLKTYYYIIRR